MPAVVMVPLAIGEYSMATQRQIEANRRNARKSTGPASVRGKAVSSMNALKRVLPN